MQELRTLNVHQKYIYGEWNFVVTYNSNIETCSGHVKAAQKKKSLAKNGS